MNKPITDYQIIKGPPLLVEKTIQQIISDDNMWFLNGSLQTIMYEGKEIVIQGMVKYDI